MSNAGDRLSEVGRHVKNWVRPFVPASLLASSRMQEFAMPATQLAARRAAPEGDLERIFYTHTGRTIHKWTPFFEAYEAHLQKWRGTPVRMLEIGVSQGGSLEMWRAYFGDQATIFGIDIDPQCADRVDPPNHVRIGSQNDAGFLDRVVAEMGGVDIVLDDGSHVGRHQIASFEVLFPLLSESGVYCIEDLHTSYWPSHEGGLGRRGTGIEFVKSMIDDLHGWYQSGHSGTPAKDQISAIHIYDSIVALEKRAKSKPLHVQVGAHVP